MPFQAFSNCQIFQFKDTLKLFEEVKNLKYYVVVHHDFNQIILSNLYLHLCPFNGCF